MLGANNTGARLEWLDALRVWAFILLMLFHTGMVFNHWPWYVKSSSPCALITYFCVWISQFRLSLLFLVSGAATALYLKKRTAGELMQKRNSTLLPPLAIGILFLSPLQILAENYFARNYPGTGARTIPFAADLYPDGFIGWHHLWFVAYLWIFTLVFLLAEKTGFTRLIEARLIGRRSLAPRWQIMVILAACLIIRDPQHPTVDSRALWGTAWGPIHYFTFFAAGYFLFRESLYEKIAELWWVFLLLSLALVIYLFSKFWWRGESTDTTISYWLRNLNQVAWTFGVFGIFRRCQIRLGAALNPQILWCFVLHQPLLLWLAVFTARATAFVYLNYFLTLVLLAASLLCIIILARSRRRLNP